MNTVDRIMHLADNFASLHRYSSPDSGKARAALLTALQELTAERDAYQVAADKLAGEIKDMQQQEPVADKQILWLWKNGDHYLAFDNLYPCFTQGGDPMTLGEPHFRAIFRKSHSRDAAPQPSQPVAQPLVKVPMKNTELQPEVLVYGVGGKT